jgi:hypothetical protein
VPLWLTGYLKKQSQFAAAQICVSSDSKGNYGNTPVCGLRKNKANCIVQRSAFGVQRLKQKGGI